MMDIVQDLFVTNLVGEPDANPRHIPESVVQDIWRRQRFRSDDLQTTTGSTVTVHDPGILNQDQGPDFISARVTIDGVVWAGAVEIHRCSADWYRHGHESDTLYNNVIIHVALIADHKTGRLRREDGSLIPEIILLHRLEAPLRQLSWDHAVGSHRAFACEAYWSDVPAEVVDPFVIRLARRRLRNKASRIAMRFLEMPDLDQIIYEETCRALGYMPNAEPMVLLARRVPLHIAQRLGSANDLLCLALGTSGLLPATAEYVTADRSAVAHAIQIHERYAELNQRLALVALPRQTWRFSRMRPGNFPTLRIAQMAALFGRGGPLATYPSELVITAVKDVNSTKALDDLLIAEPDEYWRHHVSLTKTRSTPSSALIGSERRTTVVANAFLPMISFCSESLDQPALESAALRCLNTLPAQPNQTTMPYTKRRGRPASSAVTQGLHELYQSWCTKERCLECPIGRHLSSRGCRFVDEVTRNTNS